MALTSFLVVVLAGLPAWGDGIGGVGRLYQVPSSELSSIVPAESHLLVEPRVIEDFLSALDGRPPDWRVVYGQGHHEPDLDDRLFALNRERDARRVGRPALSWLVSFLWSGELSEYDAELGGFPVALGPKFTQTSWGLIRFKPEEAPGNLLVTTDADQRERFQRRLERNETVEIDVMMTGRLLPEESLVYDFSHDEAGMGLIMPFIRVERVDFVVAQ